MTTNYGQTVYSQGSGTASTALLDAHRDTRAPTTADWQYPLGKFWVDTRNLFVYYYASQTNSSAGMRANWVQMSTGTILAGIDTINTISPDGSANFTFESSNGSIAINAITNGLDLTVATSPTTYEGNSGGLVSPDGSGTLFILGNNTTGINVVGNPPFNALTVTGIQATTTQRGTVTLATNAETIAGTDTAKVTTPDDIKAKLGTQTLHGLPVGAGTTAALTWTAAPTNGQLLIGSTGSTPVLSTLTAGSGVTITNGAGSITIAATGPDLLAYTSVTSGMSPYTVLSTDEYLGVNTTGGTVTIQLPNFTSTGRVIYIKDSSGTAATNAITVTTAGGLITIDGATSLTMNVNYQSINVVFNGSAYEVF